jgi:fluoride ion exporter CrcB/FEX
LLVGFTGAFTTFSLLGNGRVNAAPTNLAECGRRLIARLRHPGRDVHAGG